MNKYKRFTLSFFFFVVLCAGIYFAISKSTTGEKESVVIQRTEQTERNVYVCSGKYARKFHVDRECMGLSSCKGEIIVLPESQAVNHYGKCSLCSY